MPEVRLSRTKDARCALPGDEVPEVRCAYEGEVIGGQCLRRCEAGVRPDPAMFAEQKKLVFCRPSQWMLGLTKPTVIPPSPSKSIWMAMPAMTIPKILTTISSPCFPKNLRM